MNDQFKTFIKVLSDIEEFLSDVVLVGGWVPFVYQNYVWEKVVVPPHYTTDIDFGISGKTKRHRSKTIYDKFRALKYPEKHFKLDRLLPIVPLAQIDRNSRPVPVEFICDQKAGIKAIEDLLGKEIHINKVEFFDLLLRDPITASIRDKKRTFKVLIPSEERFVLHKLLTFNFREGDSKKAKDLYYAYYVLRFSPNAKDISTNLKKLPEWPILNAAIAKHFDSSSSNAVLLAEKEFGQDSVLDDTRQHIFETFVNILK